MLAQQSGSDLQADLQPEATEDLVLDAVRAPARLVGRCLADPLCDLDSLSLVEPATLAVKRGLQDRLSPLASTRCRGFAE